MILSISTRLALLCSLVLLWNAPAMAGALWQSPNSVQLSPQGARVTVLTKLPLTPKADGQMQVEFYLPGEAQHLEIVPGNGTLAQWSSSLGSVDTLTGDIASRRTALLHEKNQIQGRIAALQARMALWATPPTTALPQEQMSARQNSIDAVLPASHQELAAQQHALQEIEAQIAALPPANTQAQKIVALIDLADNKAPASEAKTATISLRYAYSLNNCGWQPDYSFNALPDAGTVQVKLFAKIWQYSGINWDNTDITLISHNSWQREPGPLRPWRVGSGDEEAAPMPINARAMPMSLAAAPQNSPLNSSDEGDAAPRKRQAPQMQDSAAFTSWHLGNRDLTEGSVLMRLSEESWASPLQWLARPSLGNSVWLMVKHNLANTRAWPTGNADFAIDGLNVGSGNFSPKGDSVTLYFGVDPRVTVLSESDPRQSGKEGFVDKRKTWDWTWKYTVFNNRTAPVNVRIEEPAPQAGDKALAISYNGKPAPQSGPQHSLFWNVEVPANSSQELNHTVTLTAPQSMKVRTGR